MNVANDQETARILAEYQRREAELPADFYALHYAPNLFSHQGQQRGLLQTLERSRLLPLNDRQILDVGCGHGQWLALFELFDASQQNIAGIELGDERATAARRRFPRADIRTGDAADLPWTDASFDIVSQATMFTSILDAGVKRRIASEMLRVLKPRGIVIWYDFLVNNPRNPNVRGVGRRELHELFPGCRIELRRMTLAPPLARRIVPVSWPLARVLENCKILNTHYLATIRR